VDRRRGLAATGGSRGRQTGAICGEGSAPALPSEALSRRRAHGTAHIVGIRPAGGAPTGGTRLPTGARSSGLV